MNIRRANQKHSRLIAVVLALATSMCMAAAPIDATFTYQGRLMDAGRPASGSFDMLFTLYDDPVQNNGVGVPVARNAVAVSGGLFTVQLEMGQGEAVFNGQRRWLGVAVRPAGGGSYTTLSPRQELTATPNATYALAAGKLALPQSITQSSIDPVFKIENPTGPAFWAEGSDVPASVAVGHGASPSLYAVNTNTGPAFYAAQVGSGPAAIINGGNVGIGTEAPQEKLTVDGTIYAMSGGVRFPDNSVQTTAAVDGPWANATGGIHYDSGDVGIGTDQPGAALDLYKSFEETAVRMRSTRFESGNIQSSTKSPQQVNMSGSGPQWTGINNALTLNGVYAQVSVFETPAPGVDPTTTSSNLDFTNVGFAIPPNMVVKQIYVNVVAHKTAVCDCTSVGVGIHADLIGAQYSSPTWTQVSDSDSAQYVLNVHPQALSAAVVNSPSFGVRLTTAVSAANCSIWCVPCPECNATAMVFVDSVTFTVEYYDPQASTSEADWAIGIPADSQQLRIAAAGELSSNPQLSVHGHGVTIGGSDVPNQNWKLFVDGEAAKPGGGSWGWWSDARLKTNIQPLAGTLDRLLSLHGYEFDYKPDAIVKRGMLPGRQIGLIAQEVECVFPDWVKEDPDGYKFVTEKSTTALMVEALRDLRREKDRQLAERDAQIDALRRRLERLEASQSAVGESESLLPRD